MRTHSGLEMLGLCPVMERNLAERTPGTAMGSFSPWDDARGGRWWWKNTGQQTDGDSTNHGTNQVETRRKVPKKRLAECNRDRLENSMCREQGLTNQHFKQVSKIASHAFVEKVAHLKQGRTCVPQDTSTPKVSLGRTYAKYASWTSRSF